MKKMVVFKTILAIVVVIVINLLGFGFFYHPISNVYKYMGNPNKIAKISITNLEKNITIELNDSISIKEFCNTINTLTFRKTSLQRIPDNSTYYIWILYDTEHEIQTNFPIGHLLRGLKDKGIVSPIFEVQNLIFFDEWFENEWFENKQKVISKRGE